MERVRKCIYLEDWISNKALEGIELVRTGFLNLEKVLTCSDTHPMGCYSVAWNIYIENWGHVDPGLFNEGATVSRPLYPPCYNIILRPIILVFLNNSE